MSLSQSSYAGEAAPLSERQARELDKKVRAASDRVATNVNALLDLLGQAQTGSIHVALGCSWRTWFKDAVRTTSADGVDRKRWCAPSRTHCGVHRDHQVSAVV